MSVIIRLVASLSVSHALMLIFILYAPFPSEVVLPFGIIPYVLGFIAVFAGRLYYRIQSANSLHSEGYFDLMIGLILLSLGMIFLDGKLQGISYIFAVSWLSMHSAMDFGCLSHHVFVKEIKLKRKV